MAVKVDITANDSGFSAKLRSAISTVKTLITSIKGAKNAQEALNAVIKANPFGLVTTLVSAAADALWNWVTGVYDAQKAQEALNAELRSTSTLLEQLKSDSDFEIAIAKAEGASSEEIMQMQLDAAKQRLDIADANKAKITAPDSKASKEQIEEATKISNDAYNEWLSLYRKQFILSIQKQYKTGEFKPRKSSRATPKADDLPTPGSIDEQTKKVKDLEKAWRAAADDDSREKIESQLKGAQLILDAMTGKRQPIDIEFQIKDETALAELNRLDGIEIDPKTMTVRADTTDALKTLSDMSGLQINLDLSLNSVRDLSDEISRLKKEQEGASNPNQWNAYATKIKELQTRAKELRNEVGFLASRGESGAAITTVAAKGIGSDWVNKRTKQLKEGGLDTSAIDSIAKGGKDISKSWTDAANAINTVSGALSSIKQPAIQVAAVVGQAIATVALAYAQTLAKDSGSKSNIFAFIAAAAAATISMATTIASIHSATGYSTGGTVQGTHYSGDMEYARLNAGETVLTRAQTGVIASALQEGGEPLVLDSVVRGDDLRIILRRGNQKRGYTKNALVL